ncbi:methyltransferase-like protein 7A [Dendronephthya gigantea]|uniref:methyltransferase-like protein 7A n=1 Tax=Dendronephthya gigantea TaxID=151771 RepID=UPI00106D59DF|nr:methyltransferase-like protein 7A [Dendronephthya gigantea]XP_028411283.1 methyltransferase-like protein 7A [Dendronephthya gigantea]XP_028411284.1 methyltransferase-like protein 7A [Dendronephthya gigantea]XP_028416488.1 methyltransferase-like protein 7A [Dendronephthya gigantea]XP_028416489.1 methyltransferase-like protein 7A [Dendronephthya gigantea]
MLSYSTLLWCALIIIVVFATRKLMKQIVAAMMKPVFAVIMYFFTKIYNREVGFKKKKLFETMEKHLEEVEGEVLEVGAGTGANFAFYPRGCTIIAVDPNRYMNYYLQHTKKFYPHVQLKEYIVGSAEDMRKIADHSMSVVVCSLVLCSVNSVEQSLKEIIRVLKPGGRFYFLEHVKGEGFLLTLQKWNQPWWFYFGDGCNLMRDTESSIRKAGFKSVKCEAFDAKNVGPFIKPHIMGYADV